MAKMTGRLLTAACIVIAVVLALKLAWNIADTSLGLRGIMWERRQAAWWADKQARLRLMQQLYKDVLASRTGATDPAEVAEDIEQVLCGRGVPVDVGYAVALIDGKICVAEMPPLAMAHHLVMCGDGRVMSNGDESLIAAVWKKALDDSTVAHAPMP
jgi:hypothetical protein